MSPALWQWLLTLTHSVDKSPSTTNYWILQDNVNLFTCAWFLFCSGCGNIIFYNRVRLLFYCGNVAFDDRVLLLLRRVVMMSSLMKEYATELVSWARLIFSFCVGGFSTQKEKLSLAHETTTESLLWGTDKFQDKETVWLRETNKSKDLLAELRIRLKEESVIHFGEPWWRSKRTAGQGGCISVTVKGCQLTTKEGLRNESRLRYSVLEPLHI